MGCLLRSWWFGEGTEYHSCALLDPEILFFFTLHDNNFSFGIHGPKIICTVYVSQVWIEDHAHHPPTSC